jgi:F-type H+-transporting ATPase subunit delta
VLPDIANLFAYYRAEQEKNMTVQVASAVTLDQDYQKKLVTSLTKRLKRQISLQCTIDPTLLGGIVVRAGDSVIDGSVRGKLNRLYESL